MNLSCLETSDNLVVTLHGDLDEAVATALPDKLNYLCIGKKQANIILDMSDCQIDGVLGYGALVAFRLAPAVLRKEVTIKNARPNVRTGMQALRFEKLFKLV